MQDDIDSLIMTALVFGLVSITFYFLVLKPIIPATPQNGGMAMHNRPGGTGAARQGQGGGGQYEQGVARGRGAGRSDDTGNNSHIEGILSKCAGYPSHLAPSSKSQANVGGSNLLSEGMVAFRHCRAAGYESSSSLDPTIVAANRKERARILSRLLNLDESGSGSGSNNSSGSGSTQTAGASSSTTASTSLATSPPPKGSTIVISIPHEDATCSKLRRIIYLLATYYNLLLIIAVPSSYKMESFTEVITKLRGSEASGDESSNDNDSIVKDILPDHRIIASATVSGRIAFVRQVGRVELVLDHDADVKSQLNRFGYRVIQYGKNKSKSDSDAKADDGHATSLLGSDLT